jgi:DnaJ-class molecular chaperone
MPKKQTIKKQKVLAPEKVQETVPKLTLVNPMKCPWCLGSGQTYGKTCPKCKGAKVIEFY